MPLRRQGKFAPDLMMFGRQGGCVRTQLRPPGY